MVCVFVWRRFPRQMYLASLPNDCCHAEVRDSSAGSWEVPRFTKHTHYTQQHTAAWAGLPGRDSWTARLSLPLPFTFSSRRRRRRRANTDCTRPVTSAECAACAKQQLLSVEERSQTGWSKKKNKKTYKKMQIKNTFWSLSVSHTHLFIQSVHGKRRKQRALNGTCALVDTQQYKQAWKSASDAACEGDAWRL